MSCHLCSSFLAMKFYILIPFISVIILYQKSKSISHRNRINKNNSICNIVINKWCEGNEEGVSKEGVIDLRIFI